MKLFHLTSCAPHRAEIVRWVSESKRPFKIVTDRAFRSLMKTGRPEYPIPSAETVSHDVRNVFVNVRKHLAKILQVSIVSYAFLIINSPSVTPGTHRGTELCDRRMDIPKPQGIRGSYGPFRKRGCQWRCFWTLLNSR